MHTPKRRRIDGKKLRDWRERRGLTLQAAADQLGITKQALHTYERGMVQPREDTLDKMLPVLKVTYEQLWREYPRRSA